MAFGLSIKALWTKVYIGVCNVKNKQILTPIKTDIRRKCKHCKKFNNYSVEQLVIEKEDIITVIESLSLTLHDWVIDQKRRYDINEEPYEV